MPSCHPRVWPDARLTEPDIRWGFWATFNVSLGCGANHTHFGSEKVTTLKFIAENDFNSNAELLYSYLVAASPMFHPFSMEVYACQLHCESYFSWWTPPFFHVKNRRAWIQSRPPLVFTTAHWSSPANKTPWCSSSVRAWEIFVEGVYRSTLQIQKAVKNTMRWLWFLFVIIWVIFGHILKYTLPEVTTILIYIYPGGFMPEKLSIWIANFNSVMEVLKIIQVGLDHFSAETQGLGLRHFKTPQETGIWNWGTPKKSPSPRKISPKNHQNCWPSIVDITVMQGGAPVIFVEAKPTTFIYTQAIWIVTIHQLHQVISTHINYKQFHKCFNDYN